MEYSANTTDLSPAPFCGTPDELMTRLGCPRDSIIFPQSQTEVTEVFFDTIGHVCHVTCM